MDIAPMQEEQEQQDANTLHGTADYLLSIVLGVGIEVCIVSIFCVTLRRWSRLAVLWEARSCHSAEETENSLP